MYYNYFGLQQPPFRITPDTSLFFPGGNRGAVLEALIYAITSGEGIVKVVGEVGSGKTMLCRMLTVELPEHVEIVYLANPSLSPDNILHAIAFELKLEVEPADDRLEVMNKLQNYLFERHANDQQVVVFVEEAQGMPLATLEQIRLLSNLETGQYKLLQIVLFGQPELDQMIGDRQIRQLKERITYSFDLGPLNRDEIKDYLTTRLRACGCRAPEVFTPGAINQISRYSKGLLRRINILADKAMLAAYADNEAMVKPRHVKLAARDTEFVSPWQRYRLPALALVLIIALVAVGWFTPFGQSLLERLPSQSRVVDSTQTIPIGPVMPEAATSAELAAAPGPAEESSGGESSQQPVVDPASDTDRSQALEGNEGNKGNEPATLTVVDAPQGPASQMGEWLQTRQYRMDRLSSEGLSEIEADEATALIEQLKTRPPETLNLADDGPPCEACSLIVYRPIKNSENL